MPRTATWKATERTLAKRLNGQRLGATGKANADVVAGHLSVECKHKRRLPGWLKDAVQQAARNAGEGQLAIVVLHEAGKRHDNDLVVVRLKDWQEWYGEVTVPEGSDSTT